jgi:hypothetical protein
MDILTTLTCLKQILVDQATGMPADDNEYKTLRMKFIGNKRLLALSPKYLRDSRDLNDFWSFIKTASPSYEGRRALIRKSLTALFEHAEIQLQNESPLKAPLGITPDYVVDEWEKAMDRKIPDPRGAITSARTLLEATCKHILTKHGIDYQEDDELQKLYGMCARKLSLHPSQHSKKEFQEILSGCFSVVKGMGSMRNKLGDAHASKIASPKPLPRHSAFAVNISCSLAMFLLETEISLSDKSGTSRG